jgi:hypothetical protein
MINLSQHIMVGITVRERFGDPHRVVSIDECYFSEKVLPLYGYSQSPPGMAETLSSLLKPMDIY